MRAFGAAEVLKVSAWKDDHLEVTGWKGISPFGPAFKEISMLLVVVSNQLPLQDDG